MKLPSRLRRLEDALFALPDDCMLLSDVDGYLAGLILCPELVPPAEWLPVIWGGVEAGPPFEDPLDVQDFEAMLVARHTEIARDLARGKFRPFFEVDPRNGDVLWDVWIEGFATAIDLRPEAWAAVDDPALAYLETLVAIADDTSDLPSEEINALYDAAAAEIPARVAALYAWREGTGRRSSSLPRRPPRSAATIRARAGRGRSTRNAAALAERSPSCRTCSGIPGAAYPQSAEYAAQWTPEQVRGDGGLRGAAE